jgi:hypothetical protein
VSKEKYQKRERERERKKKKKKKKKKNITFKLQNQIQHSVGQMDSSAFVLERI